MNLKIDHRIGVIDVKYFSKFNLTLKYDSIASTFGIEFFFDPQNPDHAEMACVSHFHECIVQHNGETLITGYLLSNSFRRNAEKQLVQMGGYSKPGVFEDCDIPITNQASYMQTDGLTLREIAQKLCNAFSLGLRVDGVSEKVSATKFTLDEKLDKKIQKQTSGVSMNIKSFLTSLAVQRNIILSHDTSGNLLFTEAKTNKEPLFHVESGVIATDINLTFNGQQIHSEITAVSSPDSQGNPGSQHTVYNPFCPIVFRPKVVIQSSGDSNTLQELANSTLAAELKNIVLVVTIEGWDINGAVIKPNNTITVYSPENYIYKKTVWFIESVNYTGDSDKLTAVLNCVLPCVYDRSQPVNIFVDAHSNIPRI